MPCRTFYLLYNEDGITYDFTSDVLLGFDSVSDRDEFISDAPEGTCARVAQRDVRCAYDLRSPIDIGGHYIFNQRGQKVHG